MKPVLNEIFISTKTIDLDFIRKGEKMKVIEIFPQLDAVKLLNISLGNPYAWLIISNEEYQQIKY